MLSGEKWPSDVVQMWSKINTAGWASGQSPRGDMKKDETRHTYRWWQWEYEINCLGSIPPIYVISIPTVIVYACMYVWMVCHCAFMFKYLYLHPCRLSLGK